MSKPKSSSKKATATKKATKSAGKTVPAKSAKPLSKARTPGPAGSQPKSGTSDSPSGQAQTGAAGAASGPEPSPTVDLDANARDAVYEAVRLEARERGMNDRDAASCAEDVCDRLRYTDHAEDHTGIAPESMLIDLRTEQDYVYPNGKRKVKTVDRYGRVPFMRDPTTVDSVVIHQTACEFGVSKRAVKRYGDVEMARARRALDVACHALAFRNGYFVAAHDVRVYVHHANRLNERSLGLEIEGRYPGLMDDPATMAREDLKTTWGGKPTELTDLCVETACDALKWLVEEGRKYGMPIKYIWAHRQSSDNRRSDPGQELWQRVVLEYAVKELDLVTQVETKWRQGYSVPTQWDANGVGDY